MSLIKSMRKYSNKIMVFLLIFIMVGFVLGASLPAIIRQVSNWFGSSKSAAVYGDNVKVDYLDLQKAQSELKILQGLMADRFLMATDREGNANNKNRLLAQVLFPDSRMAAYISSEMKRSAMQMQQGGIQASPQDIDAFFKQIEGRSDVIWLLLKAEARNAGIAVSDAETRATLRQIIQPLSGGSTDAATVVRGLSEQNRIPQSDVVNIFADLIGVTKYASSILLTEDITGNQVQALLGLSGEKINAEMVKFEFAREMDKLPQPTDEEIAAQFDKYKDVVAGNFTAENPYGFGYKQPATVVIEYMIVKTEDVKETIDAPSSQEMEDYYRNNPQRFTSSKPVDPNKPDGEKVDVKKSYSDVYSEIRGILTRQNTEAKADLIMIDAVDMLDKNISFDTQNATSELYKLNAGDYEAVGIAIGDKYNVKIYTGKTGKLSRSNMTKDKVLGSVNLQSARGMTRLALDKLVFAIDELGETQLGKFDPPQSKMWQNIGPAKGSYGSMIVLARVIEANESYAPESLELVYDINGSVTDSANIITENMYNLKENIVDDLKKVAAVDTAKQQAEKFVRLLKDKEWEDAIKEFNKDLDEKDPIVKALSLDKQREKTRSSLFNKKNMKIRTSEMSYFSAQYDRMMATDELLQEKLYSLIEPGETEAKNVRAILKSAPEQACFVVKDVSITNVTTDEYEKSKSWTAFTLDTSRSDSLALIHFAPDNIIERMGFEWNKKAETSDEDEDEDSEDTNDDTSKDGDS